MDDSQQTQIINTKAIGRPSHHGKTPSMQSLTTTQDGAAFQQAVSDNKNWNPTKGDGWTDNSDLMSPKYENEFIRKDWEQKKLEETITPPTPSKTPVVIPPATGTQEKAKKETNNTATTTPTNVTTEKKVEEKPAPKKEEKPKVESGPTE